MQRINNLFDDDSAVSPVIGVILMVAITVILAAVIASFVLGLGDQTDDVSPNISFSAEYNITSGGGNTTTIGIATADGGVDANNIYVRGDVVGNSTTTWADFGSEISAGESIELTSTSASEPTGGDEIILVFETDSTSDELDSFTVPEP